MTFTSFYLQLQFFAGERVKNRHNQSNTEEDIENNKNKMAEVKEA